MSKDKGKKVAKLVTGAKATTGHGFAQNIRREEELGKSMKRAVGTAFGEAHLAQDKEDRR